MKLKPKAMLVLGAGILLFAALNAIVVDRIVLPTFVELERAEARKDARRVLDAAANEIEHLRMFGSDWAVWDDTYAYVRDRNPVYEKANLGLTTFLLNRLTVLFVYDPAGNVVWGRSFDLVSKEFIQIAEFPADGPPAFRELLSPTGIEDTMAGLLNTSAGPMFVVSLAILTSENEGPSRGTLIMGRRFDAGAAESLSKQVGVAFQAWVPGALDIPDDAAAIARDIAGSDAIPTVEASGDRMHAYAVMPNLMGTTGLLVRADIPRSILAIGRGSTTYILLALLLAGAVLMTTIWWLFDFAIIRPVLDLSRHIVQVGQTGDLTRRPRLDRRDEIGQLADELDRMLDRLARAQEMEQQSHQAGKMEAVGKLTAGVAHNFNNLLTVILGNLDLAEGHVKKDDEIRPLLLAAQKAAERGGEMTQKLLTFARAQVLRPKRVDLADTVERTVGMLRGALPATIDLDIQAAEDLWPVEVDPAQVESALLNLAINARDAMPKGGRLSFEARNVGPAEARRIDSSEGAPDAYVSVAVVDTGSGMNPEVAERAFEPFYSTRPIEEASGLGLSAVYGTLKQIGGQAVLRSAPGEGTRVELYFPKAATQAPNASGDAEVGRGADDAPTRPALKIPKGRGETILLVEDDAQVRAATANLLNDIDYRVLQVPDGPMALDLLEKREGVDLLISDVILPHGMSGLELAEAVRKRLPGVKVLLVSGLSRDALVADGLAAGFELLAKPFRRADLARKIRGMLDTG